MVFDAILSRVFEWILGDSMKDLRDPDPVVRISAKSRMFVLQGVVVLLIIFSVYVLLGVIVGLIKKFGL